MARKVLLDQLTVDTPCNVRLLILSGAEVAAVDSEGKNALSYASENSHNSAIRLLKAQGSVETPSKEKEP